MPLRDKLSPGDPDRSSRRRSKTTSSVSTAFQEIGEKCAELQNLVRHHQLNLLYRSAADQKKQSSFSANQFSHAIPNEEEDNIITEITNILTEHTQSLNAIIKDLKIARDQSARARSLSAQLQEHRRLRREIIKSPSLSDPPHILRKRTSSIPQLVKLVDKAIDRVDVGAKPLDQQLPDNTRRTSHPWRQLVYGEPDHASRSETTSSTTEVEPFIYVADRPRLPSKSTTPRAASPPPTLIIPPSAASLSLRYERPNPSAYRPSGIPVRKKPVDPDEVSDSGASVMTAREYLNSLAPSPYPITPLPTKLDSPISTLPPTTLTLPIPTSLPTNPETPIFTPLPTADHSLPIIPPPSRCPTPHRQINPKIAALMSRYNSSHPALPFPLPEPLHVTRHGKEVSVDEHPQNWWQHDPARRPLPLKKKVVA